MSLDIQKFIKKPFEVTAVQVTSENLYEVAKWCSGDINNNGSGEKFIKVRVMHAANERQTQAFVNDWVLYAGTSYRVYTDKAFHKSFTPAAARVPLTPRLEPAFVSMAGEQV